MKQIAINGTGVIVLLQNMGKQENIDDSGGQILRQYGIGAQILLELGIGRINLLSNSPAPKVIGLEGYKLKIESCIPILEDHNEWNQFHQKPKIEAREKYQRSYLFICFCVIVCPRNALKANKHCFDQTCDCFISRNVHFPNKKK